MRLAMLLGMMAVVFSGCWAFGSDGSRLEGRYRLDALERPWTTVDPGGADFAWWHRETGATIYSDSNCEKGFSDSSLERLASAQSAAIDDAQQVSLKEHRLAERGAPGLHGDQPGLRAEEGQGRPAVRLRHRARTQPEPPLALSSLYLLCVCMMCF